MKKIINDTGSAVDDMLEGLVTVNSKLALVEGQRIVVDAALQSSKSQVAVISGGGAGHEPAHAGYVGSGMLAAAVSGDVFTSPSVDAILEGIRAFRGGPGVVLIVKNYTGDRLNFSLAAEIARSEGIATEVVMVADDVAIDMEHSAVGARGIAGTVFVHKVAGAAAARGLPVGEVARLGRLAASRIGTMGVGLTPCTVPAAGKAGFSLGDNEIELGLGIHGEAGVSKSEVKSSRELVEALLSTVISRRAIEPGSHVALLVNGLGGTPPMELAIATRDALDYLAEQKIIVKRAWTGTLLTALEMAGMSLTLMMLDDELLGYIDDATSAPAWPSLDGRVSMSKRHIAATQQSAEWIASDSRIIRSVLTSVANSLIAQSQRLNDLDQIVGDGDIGISLRRGSEAILADLDSYPLANPQDLGRALSATLRKSLGGSSGPLYAIFMLRAAEALAAGDIAAAFSAGVAGISQVGGAKVGDRTMVDALEPAADAFETAVREGKDVSEAMVEAIAAAEKGTTYTATLTARLGRSSYLGERALGVADPGAEAVVVWLKAILNGMKK